MAMNQSCNSVQQNKRKNKISDLENFRLFCQKIINMLHICIFFVCVQNTSKFVLNMKTIVNSLQIIKKQF